MNKLLLASMVIFIAGACGSETVQGPGTTTSRPGATTTVTTNPVAVQADLLAEARQIWAANRPDGYEITYRLSCECDGGPWLVRVEGGTTVLAGRVGPETGEPAPHGSIESIFGAIADTIAAGVEPVDVEYDQEFGYPRSYVHNPPGLPTDGGFILEVTSFVPNPPPGDPQQRRQFGDALSQWEEARIFDYDYQFTRGCFCPREFTGPYAVGVRAGVVATASLDGVDLFDIEMLEIGRYEEIIQTVDGVFAEIERALREADSFTAEYHPELGYPTSVYIDWIANAADEEVFYTIEDLRRPQS